MSFCKNSVTALFLIATATTAAAQSAPNEADFYVTGALGASVAGSFNGDFDLFPPNSTGDFDASPLVRLGVGHSYNGTLRAEVELSHRVLAFSDDFMNGATTLDTAGDVGVTALMLNGLYDFDLPGSDYVVYAGAGIGMARVDVDWLRGPTNPTFQLSRGDYTSLSGQLRFGVERALQNGMTVFADYNYLHVTERDFDGFNTVLGDTRQSFGPIRSHELALGVRFGF